MRDLSPILLLLPVLLGCQLEPADSCHGRIGEDGKRQYWCAVEGDRSSSWALMPRPDGSRSMGILCADTSAPKEALDRYGWCDGAASSSQAVSRLNNMTSSDADAIVTALNKRLKFLASNTGVDPYLESSDILALCEAHSTEARLSRLCAFERQRCNDGECIDVAYGMSAEEAEVLAAYANEYYLTNK